MKALTTFLAAALAAASLAAQEVPAPNPPAEPAAAQKVPAPNPPAEPAVAQEVRTAPAPNPAREPAAAINQAYLTLLPALVIVQIQVLEDPAALYEERAPVESVFDELAREHISLRVSGVRVAPDGLVLIRDPNLPLRRYGEISALDASGASLPMRVAAVLENHAALLLEPVEPQPPKPSVTFEPADIKAGDRILVGDVAFLEDALALGVDETFATAIAVEAETKLTQAIWWQTPSRDALGDATPTTAPLILDGLGRAIGIALDNSLWRTADGTDSWVGTQIMNDGRLTPATLEATNKKLLTLAHASVKAIEIQFRRDSRIAQLLRNDEGRLMSYGLLLDKSGTIFVPTELDRFAMRQIEKFSVMDGGRVEAEFLGMYRDFGAFLIRAKTVTGEPAALAEKAPFPRGRIYYTLSVRQRFGQRYDEVEYDRYLDVVKRYKESRYPVPRKRIRSGDFIAAADGRILGFCAPFRREDKDEILARQSRGQQKSGPQLRVYLFSEVAAALSDPQAHFDPDARPMQRKEEVRLVWAGVEFQPMNAALARALNAESATRGGARGLLVTDVYDASPAARSGVQVRDVLLSLSLPDSPGEIDLTARSRENDAARPEERPRPWRGAYNYLTDLLTRIGPNHEVRLKVLRADKEITVPLALEKAPDDFDNADQFEDDSLGLTVRALTYEVRNLFRLPADAPGVVVSEVQPGSKAAVGQIQMYEIISHVNNEPAKTLKDFERLIHAAEARGKVEFLVANLGVQRIVELNLAGSP